MPTPKLMWQNVQATKPEALVEGGGCLRLLAGKLAAYVPFCMARMVKSADRR